VTEIDEKEYGLLCKPSEVEPLMKALSRVYGLIWCEACYDPYNDATRQFAKKMLDDIQFANTILQFKK
jgi:hypothetical protein